MGELSLRSFIALSLEACMFCLLAQLARETKVRLLKPSSFSQTLLNIIGYAHTTYALLVCKFQPYYNYYIIDKETGLIRRKKLCRDGTHEGRDRHMCTVGCLCLGLMWYCTRGSFDRVFAIIFGQTLTPMYRCLKFGRIILLKYLIDNDNKN